MHRSGLAEPLETLIVYTGSTRSGVQSLEYSRFSNSCYMAVYKGEKPECPNLSLFCIDTSVVPEK